MNVAKIYYADIANGVGCRTSFFVSGCTHHCKDCFNDVAWDFNYGEPFTEKIADTVIESLKEDYCDGLSLLGGEPMEVVNQKELRPFVERVKREVPKATIWCYSGYTFEELMDPENKRCHSEDTLPMLKNIDVLVDGEFVAAKKDITLEFRGSSNQRIIDVQKTLESGSIVLTKYMRDRIRTD